MKIIILSLLSSLILTTSYAHTCRDDLTPKNSLKEALQNRWSDTDVPDRVIVLTESDTTNIVARFRAPLRPEFDIVILRHEPTVIALVPRNKSNELIGQQVVQWENLKLSPEEITGVLEQTKDGSVTLQTRKNSKVRTKIVVAQKLNVESISYTELVSYVRNNPRSLDAKVPSKAAGIAKFLFGKVWVQIFGPKGKINSVDASDAILKTEKVLTPGKEKFLHVSGEVFLTKLTIKNESHYSGSLAPGTYNVIARLSSSMKNIDMRNEKNEIEKNSLAISMLIFRSQNEKEVPGLLFLQDSLAPVANQGLSQYVLSSNPAFAFKPTSIREFFEQGFSVFGVALASFKSKRDSGRGLQANYRSSFGAATNGVDILSGDSIIAPRFTSIQFAGNVSLKEKTHSDAMKDDSAGHFILRTSENGRDWINLGLMSDVEWLGLDSHELTFPHGLSGTIDPQTLKATASTAGTAGLLLPVEVKPIP